MRNRPASIQMRHRGGGPDAVTQWLRRLREEKRISSTALAEKIGVTQAFISLIETGRRRPAPETADAIARVLGIPAEPLGAWLRVYTPSSPEEYREAFDTVSEHLPRDLRREWEMHRQEFGGEAREQRQSLLGMAQPTRFMTSAAELHASDLAYSSAPMLDELLRDPDAREELMNQLAAELRSGGSPLLMEALIHRAAEGDVGVGEALLQAARAGGSRLIEPMLRYIEESDPHISTRLMEKLRDRDPQLFKQAIERMSADHRPDIVRVPILPEGKDPGPEDAPVSKTVRWVQVDRGLLPHDHSVASPFAYELSEDGVRRVRDALGPGDIAVITRDAWPLIAGEICALELRGKIVLSRVAAKSGTLLVLSSDPALEVELLPLGEKAERPGYLRGRVVVAVRRWGRKGP